MKGIEPLTSSSSACPQNTVPMELAQSLQSASQHLQSKNSLEVDFFDDALDVLGYKSAVIPKHSTLSNKSIMMTSSDRSGE